ncbi:MAG: NADP-dependent oxidoreductase [Denitrovibrio sp.]|nr:MAG: NADP-dependent oxidoreductase [Denitrovibrio sp.]
MKAVIIEKFGEPSELKLADIEKPTPKSDEILIKIAGAGVNPVDAKTRRGLGFVAESIKNDLPWIPGFDVAGVVESIGGDVTEFVVGDRVFGRLDFIADTGGYCEYTTTKAKNMAKAPENIELVYAAALPVAGMTAWQGLFSVGNVKEGDRVLIHAGAGGVGHLAVQFAKIKGAYVICTASKRNHSFLLELGADEVVDYNTCDFTNAIEPVDFILDNMGFEVGERSVNVLKPEGMMVTVPTITAERVCKAGEAKGVNVQGIKVEISSDNLSEIANLVDKGYLRVFVSNIYTLDQAVSAHIDIETGSTRGKLVIGIA